MFWFVKQYIILFNFCFRKIMGLSGPCIQGSFVCLSPYSSPLSNLAKSSQSRAANAAATAHSSVSRPSLQQFQVAKWSKEGKECPIWTFFANEVTHARSRTRDVNKCRSDDTDKAVSWAARKKWVGEREGRRWTCQKSARETIRTNYQHRNIPNRMKL